VWSASGSESPEAVGSIPRFEPSSTTGLDRFEQLLQAAPDAIVCVAPNGQISSANTQAEQLFGYARHELVGMAVDGLVPERFRFSHGVRRAGVFRAPSPRPMGSGHVLYARRKDGSEFPCEISLSAIAAGVDLIAVAAIRDVSARIRVARLYQAIAENFPNGAILLFDHELRHLLARGEGLHRIGIDPAAVEGRTLAESWDGETVDVVEPLVRQALGGERVHADLAILGRWLRVTVVPLLEDPYGVFAAMLVGQDVTAQHDTEQALRRSEDRRNHALSALVEAQELERARIAADLHDDTIQVMTAALLRLDASQRKLPPDSEADCAVTRARHTLSDAIERTRKLTFDLRPQLLEAEGLASAIGALCGDVAGESGFHPELDIDVRRYSDVIESLIFRTVQEALANIQRHAHATRVRITVHETDGVVHGTITDDGGGFDVRSVRARARATHHFGMDISAERVRLAGGTLDIASEPGKGTQVGFSLPVHRAADTPS
jgi:PAS domain S-box-containing protein